MSDALLGRLQVRAEPENVRRQQEEQEEQHSHRATNDLCRHADCHGVKHKGVCVVELRGKIDPYGIGCTLYGSRHSRPAVCVKRAEFKSEFSREREKRGCECAGERERAYEETLRPSQESREVVNQCSWKHPVS
jgi:hypothetical protein